MPQTILTDRAVLSLTGEDRLSLLQGLVTVDIDRLKTQSNVFGALLAPQGKIQFDFFLHNRDDSLLIDIDAGRSADFLKRMKMYKLRSKVEIEDVSSDHHVFVRWGNGSSASFDARSDKLGSREIISDDIATDSTADNYHAHRVAFGVPEAGKDFAFDDIFPHDAMMDALGGVDFKKGCYVGQEVVSRVQHRSTARKRFFILKGNGKQSANASVFLGGKSVGTTGAPYGEHVLALLRADKLEGSDEQLSVDGQTVEALIPSYFTDFKTKTA